MIACRLRRSGIFLIAWALSVVGLHSGILSASEANTEVDSESINLGKRIYREGILSSGSPLRGIVQGDIPISGTQLACVSCHKRSGFGTSEGGAVTPVITGDVLYAETTTRAKELYTVRNEKSKTRPAYTDITLAEAIRSGKGAGGGSLDRLMPRFELPDDDMRHLQAYLKTLLSSRSPGVSDREIQFATVFEKSLPQEEKRAILRTLRQFIHDRNTDVRPNTRRAQVAPWHKKWPYESHRVWNLTPWEVEGLPETWAAQLNLLYSRQPVFAILSGDIGLGEWAPIHEFCEARELPCIFPNTLLPPAVEKGFYTVYFSRGLLLEAEVLAKYLSQEKAQNKSLSILQVVQAGPSGRLPAATLMEQLTKQGFTHIRELLLSNPLDLSVVDKSTLSGADIVIYWVDQPTLTSLQKHLDRHLDTQQLFISASLVGLGDKVNTLKGHPGDLGKELFVLYPYEKPQELQLHLDNTQRWMTGRDVRVVDPVRQANTLYAVTVVSRALKHMGSNFSRHYLLERVEHMEQNIAVSPVYPRMALGPGQRYATKGAYITKLELDATAKSESTIPEANKAYTLSIVSDWIVP